MSTKSANLYARIEPDVKEQAESILSALARMSLGIAAVCASYPSITTVCCIFLTGKKAVATIIRVMYGGRDIETLLKKYTRLYTGIDRAL